MENRGKVKGTRTVRCGAVRFEGREERTNVRTRRRKGAGARVEVGIRWMEVESFGSRAV